LKRIGSYYLKHHKNKKDVFWGPSNWRAPYPFDGEHWRTRKEIEDIFSNYSCRYQIVKNTGNLCIKNPSFYDKLAWAYYFAILEF
jgi:hypothetical protein